MGLPRQVAEIILQEHLYKPIQGEILLCGRQTVQVSPNGAKKLLTKYGVPIREGVEPEVDKVTRAAPGDPKILDRSFFELFTDARFNAVDLTDYEQANIIHDMCTPIGEDLVGRFSFIYNGSCMDNVSSPAQFLVNTSRMLEPNGVVCHLEHGSPASCAYIMYSPDIFLDYYAANKYVDCKVYVALFEGDLHTTHWNVFQWDPIVVRSGLVHYTQSTIDTQSDRLLITIAEKGPDSTDDVLPVQAQYRPTDMNRAYTEAALRFRESERPVLGTGVYRPIEPHNFPRFCGSL